MIIRQQWRFDGGIGHTIRGGAFHSGHSSPLRARSRRSAASRIGKVSVHHPASATGDRRLLRRRTAACTQHPGLSRP